MSDDKGVPKGAAQEMNSPDEWARKGSAPTKQEVMGEVAPRKYGTMVPKKTLYKGVAFDVEIYKAFGGAEYENDSGDEAEKEKFDPEANDATEAFNPGNDTKTVKTVMARATIAGVNSWSKTFFFLVKGFLGSGMLTLPMGFCNGGAVFSIACLAVVCIFSIMGMTALLEIRTARGGSFSDMAYEALGKPGRIIIDISLACCQVYYSPNLIIDWTRHCLHYLYLSELRRHSEALGL